MKRPARGVFGGLDERGLKLLLAAFFLALTVLTPYIVGRLMAYTSGLLGDLSRYAR